MMPHGVVSFGSRVVFLRNRPSSCLVLSNTAFWLATFIILHLPADNNSAGDWSYLSSVVCSVTFSSVRDFNWINIFMALSAFFSDTVPCGRVCIVNLVEHHTHQIFRCDQIAPCGTSITLWNWVWTPLIYVHKAAILRQVLVQTLLKGLSWHSQARPGNQLHCCK